MALRGRFSQLSTPVPGSLVVNDFSGLGLVSTINDDAVKSVDGDCDGGIDDGCVTVPETPLLPCVPVTSLAPSSLAVRCGSSADFPAGLQGVTATTLPLRSK